MSKMIIPEDYKPHLNLIETEVAIKMIKDTFERRLAEQLRLTRVSAPLFLLKNTGLNDNLNGIEKPVSFTSFELNHDDEIEIIHSLAKWKRDALHRYGFEKHTGLYTDMNAIRKDEELDNIHSMYVDQWDWEYVISEVDRTLDYFKAIVSKIYNALLDVEFLMIRHYPQLGESILPDESMATILISDILLSIFLATIFAAAIPLVPIKTAFTFLTFLCKAPPKYKAINDIS